MEIDNAEPAHADGARAFDMKAFVIRAAVPDLIAHRLDEWVFRFSIEQGWFGPGMRVVLGALLALALIAAGEWTRRTENLSGVTGLPTAHIPSILTAAGTAVAYADVWAAYRLYDFLGAGAAFILLGLVALARRVQSIPEVATS